jgi:hypothetical protein
MLGRSEYSNFKIQGPSNGSQDKMDIFSKMASTIRIKFQSFMGTFSQDKTT